VGEPSPRIQRSRSSEAFPRSLAARVRTRTAVFALGFLGLIFLFQLLRAATLLPTHGLPVRMLPELVLYIAPSLLSLALPMSLALATAVTFADAASHGEIDAWEGLGRSTWELVRRPLRLGLWVTLFVALLVTWLGPWSLRRAAEVMRRFQLEAATDTLDGGRGVRLAEGSWIWGEGRLDEQGLLELNEAVVVTAQATPRASLQFAGSLGWSSKGLEAQELGWLQVDEAGACQFSGAERLTASIPSPLGHAFELIPVIETQSLWLLLESSGPRPRGQVFKRLMVLLLPLPMLFVVLRHSVRTQRFRRAGNAAVLALLLSASMFGVTRVVELSAREGVWSGVLTGVLALSVWVMAGVGWPKRS